MMQPWCRASRFLGRQTATLQSEQALSQDRARDRCGIWHRWRPWRLRRISRRQAEYSKGLSFNRGTTCSLQHGTKCKNNWLTT